MDHPVTSAQGSRWAIATPHELASRAGAEAFERGGTAVDAALAAATTLAVAYPHMCGVGGDLFAVVHRPEGDTLAVNASGRSARGADPEALRRRHGASMPLRGPDPITVPGAPSGWSALHRIGGALPWADAFSAAIRLAHAGTPVTQSLGGLLGGEEGRRLLDDDAGLAGVFSPHGPPLTVGETFVQPALGRTLEALAAGGAEALYRGPVGAAYVEGLRAAGSPLSLEDLAAHEASILPPLLGRFTRGGIHVAVAPPNSQGFSLLQLLAAADRMGIDPDPLGPDAGTLARIFLAGLRDVRRHLADPERMTVHPSTLLDDGHLAAFCDDVRGPLGGPTAATPRPAGDTIALVAADAQGTVVSLIQSLFHGFGAGILEPQTGIVAHDRGACFTLEPGHANSFAPGALPLHTLLPAVLLDDRGVVGAAGTMGGYQQAQIDAHTIVHAFAGGRSPGEAVAAPRWIVDDLPEGKGIPAIVAEADVAAAALDALQATGLPLEIVPARSETVGHAHLIRIGAGVLAAGSDPRADGCALAG